MSYIYGVFPIHWYLWLFRSSDSTRERGYPLRGKTAVFGYGTHNKKWRPYADSIVFAGCNEQT